MNEELRKVKEERDDLAAHVERLTKVMRDVQNGPEYIVARQHRAMRIALGSTPETSLARLKAQWQAEALDSLESRIKPLRQTDNGAQGKGYNLALEDCLAAIDMVRRQAGEVK